MKQIVLFFLKEKYTFDRSVERNNFLLSIINGRRKIDQKKKKNSNGQWLMIMVGGQVHTQIKSKEEKDHRSGAATFKQK